MRIVVADDSVLLREGIVRLLQEADLDVVAQAASADDLMRKVRAHKPDIAIVDIRMPPGNADDGLQAAREIRAELPATSVLVLSQYVDEHYVVQLLEDGADGVGYLLKDRIGDVDSFLDAIRRVAGRGIGPPPPGASPMAAPPDGPPPPGAAPPRAAG